MTMNAFGPAYPRRQALKLVRTTLGCMASSAAHLVGRIDVVLEDQDDTTVEVAQELLSEARAMLRPSEEGDGFERSYYEALQRTPDVVLAHATVKKLLSTACTAAAA